MKYSHRLFLRGIQMLSVSIAMMSVGLFLLTWFGIGGIDLGLFLLVMSILHPVFWPPVRYR